MNAAGLRSRLVVANDAEPFHARLDRVPVNRGRRRRRRCHVQSRRHPQRFRPRQHEARRRRRRLLGHAARHRRNRLRIGRIRRLGRRLPLRRLLTHHRLVRNHHRLILRSRGVRLNGVVLSIRIDPADRRRTAIRRSVGAGASGNDGKPYESPRDHQPTPAHILTHRPFPSLEPSRERPVPGFGEGLIASFGKKKKPSFSQSRDFADSYKARE
jgi:hypothetical protein